VVVAATLALAGCDEKALDARGVTSSDAGAHATSASLRPEQSSRVLAKVGEHSITLGDYAAALEHMDQFDRLRYQAPERRKELLNEIINVELLAQEATAKGYDKEPLAQQELRAILRDAMLAEARKGVPSPADIPESEVRAYYEAHKAEHRDPERRRLSVIVLKDEAAAKDVLEAAKKTTTAAQWGELVRQKSTDGQARVNVPVDLAGDFGFVSPPGDPKNENPRVPDEVRRAAYEIPNVNDVLGRVLKSGARFYLVRLTQKSDPRERSLEEAQRTIRVLLAQERVRVKELEVLQQLRVEIPVQLDETALASLHQRFRSSCAPRRTHR
jgi:peptidyl-prolyl cis-trans isomerase C